MEIIKTVSNDSIVTYTVKTVSGKEFVHSVQTSTPYRMIKKELKELAFKLDRLEQSD
ncbi:hypothetical protein [Staphylococcus nepalensis]|uniref:hypothetical protein n=1 Tax=Staphylococcus nepalensis TaxID=214473 RepID=UPI00131F09C8|nr:hypothetical protein [Staphylococcus nepalensis]